MGRGREKERERRRRGEREPFLLPTHGPHEARSFIQEIDMVATRDSFTWKTRAFYEAKYMIPSSLAVKLHPCTGLSALPPPPSPPLLFLCYSWSFVKLIHC